MHRLLEEYYKGQLSKDQMLVEYLTKFSSEVQGERPAERTVDKYIKSGAEYIRNFKPVDMEILGVEKKVQFRIGENQFIGYIDLLARKDGKLYIIDHKSRELKPRSHRKKPTVKDMELDEMLRQLYIYSAAVKEGLGEYPAFLCFNCFRNGVLIEEPFLIEEYNRTIKWAEDTIEEIKSTDDFPPNIEYFPCKFICGVCGDCVYTE